MHKEYFLAKIKCISGLKYASNAQKRKQTEALMVRRSYTHLHYFTKTHGGCGHHLNSRPNACLSFLTKQNVSPGSQSSSDVTFIIGLRENIKGQQEMFVSERAITFNKLCFINRGSFKVCCCSSCLILFYSGNNFIKGMK